MKNDIFPFTIEPNYKSKKRKLTPEQANSLFTREEIEKGEKRADIKSIGPWSIITSVKAIAVSTNFETGIITIYGPRTMTNCRQSGHEIEGWTSIKGKKVSCFTSSRLFELEDNKLVSCAIIHVRSK